MNGRLKNWLRGGALYFLLELALVAALALTLAYWTWVFVAPRSVAAPANLPHTPLRGEQPASAREIFGVASGAEARAVAVSGLRLVGVAAPSGRGEGRAVFALEGGKAASARAGESVLPGVVVKEIHPDHAVLERDGRTERVALERRAASVDGAPRARRDGGR